MEGRDISRDAMRAVMTMVMTGEATQAQIGALLVALRMKGEAIDEITGAAEVMRELVTSVVVEDSNLVDLVGTGGDGANLFNVSTAATFVAAAAGARVAFNESSTSSVSAASCAAAPSRRRWTRRPISALTSSAPRPNMMSLVRDSWTPDLTNASAASLRSTGIFFFFFSGGGLPGNGRRGRARARRARRSRGRAAAGGRP